MQLPRAKFKYTGKKFWVRLLDRLGLVDLFATVAVPILAIKGVYPWWLLTPDDKVSPFGSGTTPGASTEKSQVAVYTWGTKVGGSKFGRWLGDSVWLGWRNRGYGVSYWLKPDWLKRPGIEYHKLNIFQEGNVVWLEQPDGTWLWETTRKVGPFYLLTGFRLTPILSGALEDRDRIARGEPPVPRPIYHPNMDARPIISVRSKRSIQP